MAKIARAVGSTPSTVYRYIDKDRRPARSRAQSRNDSGVNRVNAQVER